MKNEEKKQRLIGVMLQLLNMRLFKRIMMRLCNYKRRKMRKKRKSWKKWKKHIRKNKKKRKSRKN